MERELTFDEELLLTHAPPCLPGWATRRPRRASPTPGAPRDGLAER
jgi:hypothetical protein